MKLKVYFKRVNHSDVEGTVIRKVNVPKFINKGDLIDLRSAIDVDITGPQSGTLKSETHNGVTVKHRDVTFSNKLIPLGICMKMPKGFKANVYPRSGTYKNYGIVLSNSVGQIDNSYSSNKDEWMANYIALRDTRIDFNDRICQFEIVPSMKATFWQKLKWLFCSGFEFIEVDDLGDESRGGFSSTGVK